jgi:capsular polysaccharide transport system permease protein
MKATLTLFGEHSRVIWALMLRELATRYGRDNLGFLWVIVEPFIFCACVMLINRAIRGPYDHGLGVVPFIMTGYMPTILVRHVVTYSVNAIKINSPLLYHRNITILDLFMARIVLELIGVSLAFAIVTTILIIFGLCPPPERLGIVYQGWFICGLNASGMALMVGSISELVEVVERIIGVTLYILVPVSGTFFLADWLPPDIRSAALILPFLHCAEMVRYGFFGDAIIPHYNAAYAITFGAVMALIGLLLMRYVRDRVELI